MKKKNDYLIDSINKKCRINEGGSFKINDYDTNWSDNEELAGLSDKKLKKRARKVLKNNLKQLTEAQELLYASNKKSLLLVFQAMDAAGKDGTINHVMSGVNPQGCQVYSFKKPSALELDHNFLWRYTLRTPQRGNIGIFNRSYYEDVLVVKVNQELLTHQYKDEEINTEFWQGRYEDINNLEKHLERNGTIVLKFFLNVSKKEQRNRFLDRLNNPEKHWKFSDSDLKERGKWDKYMNAFEDAINATSTKKSPWYIIPADHKWIMRSIISTIITETILSLKPKVPEVTTSKKELIDEALRQLNEEG